MGELWWRHPHPVVRRVPCTTHVVVSELGQAVQLTVRVYADGGEEALGGPVAVGQARPTWLSALAHDCRMSAAWGDATPVCLTANDVESFVREVLFSDARDWPVVLLSAYEAGGHVLPPDEVADEFLGLARVYYLDTHDASFALTDQLGGKELSCFWGATRVYLPRFSCADDPLDHALLFPDEMLDPAERADVRGALALGLRDAVPVADGIAARRARSQRSKTVTEVAPVAVAANVASAPSVATDAALPAGALGVSANGVSANGASAIGASEIGAAIGAVATQLEVLAGAISRLAHANRELFAEVAQLRTGNGVRLASINSIERRLERLDRFVREDIQSLLPVPAPQLAEVALPTDEVETSLAEVVREASARNQDALLVLPSAEESATDSPYEDADRVAQVLDAMADIARHRQQRSLGKGLKDVFRDYGIDYRGAIAESTSAKQRAQYRLTDERGQTYDCVEHIVLGSTYDPRYCLRIYFTSRAPLDQRFVIGHVGRHFEVITTT